MTLAERFIVAFRLPYALGCVLLGFGLFGIVNTAVSAFVANLDLRLALLIAFSPQSLAQSALFAYAFYAPRYMRRKLSEAERSLPAVVSDKEGFRKIFAGTSSTRPQIVAWVLFLAALLLALNIGAFLGGQSTIAVNLDSGFSLAEFLATVFDIVSLAAVTLALSSVVWTYWSISSGIRRFSSAALELRPYYEDPFLGLKPIGDLSLSLATVYFGFIALLTIAVLASASTPTIGDILGVGGFLFGLILLGLLFFFLPLNTLHKRMISEKQAARARLSPALRSLLHDSSGANSPTDPGHAFRVDMMDRKVSSMAVWPFDVGVIGRLSVIAFSVTAILISRILALLLHI